MVNTLDELLCRIVALDGGGSDRGERCATGRFGHRVCLGRRRCALMPSGSAVNAHRKVIVGFARLEFARVIVSRHVPVAAHLVVGVLAVLPRIGASASAHAELRGADEAGPFGVLTVRSEGVAEDKTTNGVAVTVRAVGIQFTALVTLLHINLGQITGTSDLDIVLGTDKMNAFEGTFRHDAGASAALGAPSDFVPLSVTNSANRGRRPQAEIIGIVHPHCLAVRGLRRLGAAGVGTKLTTLGLGGQLVVNVTRVPNLVVIILMTVAGPNLNFVSGRQTAARQIDTSTLGPFDMVVTEFCVAEFLIGVLGAAVPYLKLGAIGILSTGDIYTLSTVVNRDGTVRAECPFLVRGTCTTGYLDRSAVLIVSSEALSSIDTRLNEKWPFECRACEG